MSIHEKNNTLNCHAGGDFLVTKALYVVLPISAKVAKPIMIKMILRLV